MSHTAAARSAGTGAGAYPYQRHRPEQTLLYQIIEQHYPLFATHMAAQGRPLPDYVQGEFEGYLQCGRLEQGFLRVRCESRHSACPWTCSTDTQKPPVTLKLLRTLVAREIGRAHV